MKLEFKKRRLDLKVNENFMLEALLKLDDDFYLKKSQFCKSFIEFGSSAAINAWRGLEKKGYINTQSNTCDSLARFTYDVFVDGVCVKKFNYNYYPKPRNFRLGDYSYVYLYSHDGNKNTKIGVTNHIKNRLSSLNIGSGYQTDFLFYGKTHRHIEGLLHRFFLPKRVWGEWFSLSKQDIEKAIEIIKENEVH